MIYLDSAATSYYRPREVAQAVYDAILTMGNAGRGSHASSLNSARMIYETRCLLNELFHGPGPEQVVFTSNATEALNIAIQGLTAPGVRMAATAMDHNSVLRPVYLAKERGCSLQILDVDEKGMVDPDRLESAIRPDTILISVMAANNEIGTIEPISRIGAIAHEHGILFHTDAVQAYGQIPLDVNAMNIDMLSSSGHKLNGPKGIGFLYIRSGIKLGSFIHGGQQERGRRAGTENVPGIVGMGKAAELAMLSMEDRMKQETDIRDHIIHRILSEIPYSRLNGHDKDRLPNNVNVSFQFVEGETILIMLDMAGICASAGSACTSGSVDPSHVLTAIGLPKEISHGAVRLTLGYENTMDEADAVVDNLKRIVENLRKMSPAYQDFARRNM